MRDLLDFDRCSARDSAGNAMNHATWQQLLAALQQHIASSTMARRTRPRTSLRSHRACETPMPPQAKSACTSCAVLRAQPDTLSPDHVPHAVLQHSAQPARPCLPSPSRSTSAPARHAESAKTLTLGRLVAIRGMRAARRHHRPNNQARPRRPSRRAHARRRGRVADTTTVRPPPPL